MTDIIITASLVRGIVATYRIESSILADINNTGNDNTNLPLLTHSLSRFDI